MTPPISRTAKWLVIVLMGLIWFMLPGYRDLAEPDEGRYAEIPREMVESGDWLTPRLNGFKYKPGADKVELVDVSSGTYYREGYQDIQTRVPWIENTKTDLQWSPRVSLHDALRNIFAAYRHEVGEARALLDC